MNKKTMCLSYLTAPVIFFLLFFLGVTNINGQGEKKIRLIVRGDDIGFCHAANVGCIEAYRDGIMKSVEIIVPAPWFNEAVEMLKNNPGLDVGIHLTVTCEWDNLKWGPVASKSLVPSLVDKDGYFYQRTVQEEGFPPNTGFREANPDPAELEIELRAQIERALSKISNITHLSIHMGAPTCKPELKAVVEKLSLEYNLPVDVPDSKNAGSFVSRTSVSADEIERNLVELLESLEPGNLYILVEHPGMDTPEMRAIGHLNYRHVAQQRDGVTKAFTSAWVKDVIRKRGIELLSYGEALSK